MTFISRTIVSALAAASVGMAAIPTSAHAMECGPREAIVSQLAEQHGEQQVVMGLAADGSVMELWAGNTGGWTLLASLPTGLTCVVAVGTHAEMFALLPDHAA